MKKIYSVILASMLLCLFCQHPNSPSPTPDTDQPGSFSLTQLQGLQKTAATTASDTNTINLGDLHSTTNYYFLLTNCGGHCITNINLSVSDSSFVIFPTSIDSLTVGLGTQSLVPIIKLTALHGTGAQGFGSEPLMSQGVHQVHINISGTTKHNNTDTNTSLTAAATINALLMDLNVHSALKVIDFTNPATALGAAIDNYNVSMIYGYATNDSTDSVVTIVNTGNVTLNVKHLSIDMGGGGILDSATSSINVSDSSSFNVLKNVFLYFVVDGNNTVCNPDKLQMQSNGKAYFFILRG
jgi:hypothetical protein